VRSCDMLTACFYIESSAKRKDFRFHVFVPRIAAMRGRRDPDETGTANADLFFWNNALGMYLREARRRHDLSLRELERQSGVSDSEILKVESGSQECRLSSFVKLCSALGLPGGLVLDQVVSSSSAYFSTIIHDDPAFEKLTLRWTAGAFHAEALSAQMACICAVASHLLRCSNAFGKARSFNYPDDELRNLFESFARRIDNLDDPLDRTSVLMALKKQPIREIESQGLMPLKFLDSFVGQLNRLKPAAPGIHRGAGVPIWYPLPAPANPLGRPTEKNNLRDHQVLLDNNRVKKGNRYTWGSLRRRIRAATRERGARARLARKFRVTPQAVAEWLSGASAPTAETTLRLLEWVTAEEAKQKKSAGNVSETRPARKTQTRKSKHEKPHSDHRKKR
jgi:transcriptional regulator with XRE-family HTH domain